MTERFLARCGLTDELALPETYEKVAIVEDCMDFLFNAEGKPSPWVVSTATSYTHSMFYEMLDNIKEFLLQAIQKLLSLVNNYYLNNVNLLDKYREAIMDRLDKVKEPIKQITYEYPELKDYPKTIKATITGEKDVIGLQEKIISGEMVPQEVAGEVDRLLARFGKDVLGAEIDPYDIKDSVTQLVQEKVRGSQVTITITKSTIDKYIKDMMRYKKDKEEIQRTKKAILEDYEILKKTYAKVTANPVSLAKNDPKVISDPRREAFIAREAQRYADIHVQMMRLFNGYLAIYREAFNARLAELDAKFLNNRNTINEIITRTGLFTTLNTKNPDKNRKPIPYNPVNMVK